MNTALQTDDLQGLQDTLRGLLEGLPLELQCSSQEGALMILGQHPADFNLEPQDIFRRLERQIQSLQLRFGQQARLYLRVAGESQPYAQRFFLIQPPPPPRPVVLEPPAPVLPSEPEEPWELSDEELDSWLQELVGTAEGEAETTSTPPFLEVEDLDATTAGASLSLIPWEEPEDRLAEHALPLPDESDATPRSPLNSRLMLTGGAIAMGMVSGVYGLSRPCMVGSCSELQTVQTWSQDAIQQAEQATDAADLAAARASMQRAIATLETIPAWSRYAGDARTLRHTYAEHHQTLEYLTQIAELAQTASDRSDNAPHSVETWQGIIELWQDTINRLEAIPPENPFYRTAQRQKQHYEEQLARHQRTLTVEDAAQDVLNMARQGIQMAEARQQIAQTPEQWQVVRITWQVVVNRLQEVPPGTYAAVDARRLLQSYQPRIGAAIAQLEKEQKATDLLQQATQSAQVAQQAAQQFNWEGAIAAWTSAIRYTEQVPSNTAKTPQAAELTRSYTTAINQAKEQLDATLTISLDVDRACNQELRKCRLVRAGNAIHVQLTPGYMSAITTARESGNRDLQAVVTEHQMALRRTLEGLAARFQRPVEVYDDRNSLLDRHLPPQVGG